jgi:hypothetical protein
MTSGADELRRARGSELVTFDDVADHLEDFASSFRGGRVGELTRHAVRVQAL